MNKTERRKMYRYIANMMEETGNPKFICVEIGAYVHREHCNHSIRQEVKRFESTLLVPKKICGLAWLSDYVGSGNSKSVLTLKVKILRLLASGRKDDLLRAQNMAKVAIDYKMRFH